MLSERRNSISLLEGDPGLQLGYFWPSSQSQSLSEDVIAGTCFSSVWLGVFLCQKERSSHCCRLEGSAEDFKSAKKFLVNVGHAVRGIAR